MKSLLDTVHYNLTVNVHGQQRHSLNEEDTCPKCVMAIVNVLKVMLNLTLGMFI